MLCNSKGVGRKISEGRRGTTEKKDRKNSISKPPSTLLPTQQLFHSFAGFILLSTNLHILQIVKNYTSLKIN